MAELPSKCRACQNTVTQNLCNFARLDYVSKSRVEVACNRVEHRTRNGAQQDRRKPAASHRTSLSNAVRGSLHKTYHP